MAVGDLLWSYGTTRRFESSGETVGDGDDIWSYGQVRIIHEYVAGGEPPGGGVFTAVYYSTLMQGDSI